MRRVRTCFSSAASRGKRGLRRRLSYTSGLRSERAMQMTSKQATTTLWRPTGPKELDLVRELNWRAWPPRLPEQPIFYLGSTKATSVTHLSHYLHISTHLRHRSPQPPSRLPLTHTLWSRRGAWRGGARHYTNDLDARCRVCSALLGSTVGGMGAPPHSPLTAGTRQWRPTISEPERPRGGMSFPRPRLVGTRPSAWSCFFRGRASG